MGQERWHKQARMTGTEWEKAGVVECLLILVWSGGNKERNDYEYVARRTEYRRETIGRFWQFAG